LSTRLSYRHATMNGHRGDVETLSTADVLHIHETLCKDFAESEDPIAPAGVRSMHLLESAVSRQDVGLGRRLKYPDPISNAASLAYGICNNHPFYNGNKRTALVALLAHLDKNRLVLVGVRQPELYNLMLSVASHTLGAAQTGRRGSGKSGTTRRRADDEVGAIITWLTPRVQRVTRGEHPITYRELRQVLKDFGYILCDPNNNSIDVCREVDITSGLFRRQTRTELKKIGNIPYPGDRATVGVRLIKQLRRMCELTEQNGIDSDSFYSRADVVDVFINEYRVVLRRLART
jgi:prophage maintenance system killer protein